MDPVVFLAFAAVCVVLPNGCTASHAKTKATEPHPYTISFFTFPQGTNLLEEKPKTKRHNEETGAAKKQKLGLSNNSTKHFVETYEKSTRLDKTGKAPDAGPEKGLQKIEPGNVGSSHGKIQLKVQHHHHPQTDETFQEGSIRHRSHKMFPKCHHCPANSTYDDCVKESTLRTCNEGLDNICFTKTFKSGTRGMIYEMGCSNHKKCKKAKALPCEGKENKCFICCQYDGCNAWHDHNAFDSRNDDETEFEYLNKATMQLPSPWIIGVVVLLNLMCV